jgi:HPt (histidine-containing phosphotransfer) domain-containing protein
MADAVTAGRPVALRPEVLESLGALAFEEPPPAAPAPVEEQPASAARPEPAAASAFDPEIAGIFAEEAAEILDSSQAALQDVRQRQDQSAVARLQRFLHTLKGGARMAGLLAMGDLSHALETLFVRIGEASNGATPAALDLVQRGLDELQQMRDSVDAGRAISPAAALVAELEGFDAARAEPAAAPAPSPRAPAIPRPRRPRRCARPNRYRLSNGSIRPRAAGRDRSRDSRSSFGAARGADDRSARNRRRLH